jgi:hypothetical protein
MIASISIEDMFERTSFHVWYLTLKNGNRNGNLDSRGRRTFWDQNRAIRDLMGALFKSDIEIQAQKAYDDWIKTSSIKSRRKKTKHMT